MKHFIRSVCEHQQSFKVLGSEIMSENWKSLKVMKNSFYFILKAIFVLEIFAFLSWLFGYLGKRLDKKVKVNSNIYDVTDWTTNNYNTNIAQYLKK